MPTLRSLVDWRRALLLLPLLAAIGAAVYFLAVRETDSSTPRAALLSTTAPADASVGTRTGNFARDFVAYSPDGVPVRLSELRGRPVIINFWATWCTSCLAELPDLQELQQELGPDSVTVVALNAGESSGRASRYLDDLGIDGFHAGMDPTLVVADAYGVQGMPHSLFIDGDGYVRAVYTGQMSMDRMRENYAAAAAGTDQLDESGPLRIVTTVARERVLEVRELDDGRVEFRSKSLRCDDAYCAATAVDALARAQGVVSIERHLDADPATVVVRYDPAATNARELASRFVEELQLLADPLYTRPIEVAYR